jgi:hypothetical protein
MMHEEVDDDIPPPPPPTPPRRRKVVKKKDKEEEEEDLSGFSGEEEEEEEEQQPHPKASGKHGSYVEYYYDFLKELNGCLTVKSNQDVDWRSVSQTIQRFADDRNKELGRSSVSKWCSPYLINKDFSICIFAHGKHPTRCLALIDVATGLFTRLQPCERKGLKGGRKLHSAANKLQLASTKRGFWLALQPMISSGYTVQSLKDETKLQELLNLYDTHVAGMEKNPFKGEQAKLPMKQQFDIERYPNSTWTSVSASASEVVVTKDPGNAKKRKRLHYAGESFKQPRICDLVVSGEVPKFTEYLANKQQTSAASILLSMQKTRFPADEIDIGKEMRSMNTEQIENEVNFLRSCDMGNCGLDDDALDISIADRIREEEEEEVFKFDFGD